MKEAIKYNTRWTICKYASQEDFEKGIMMEAPSLIEGNILLNEGIGELLLLLSGGSATAFNNANSYIGVGDSSTAATAAQTGLQAAVNKTYKAMEALYPVITNQTITFRSVFGANDGNYAWEEFTVANGNSDTAVNLNRKCSSEGTKSSGQVWTVNVAITFA